MAKPVRRKRRHQAPPETQAIVPVQAQIVHDPANETVDQALAQAQKQINFRKGLLKIIAASIDPHDIVLYGKPGYENVYFQKAACKFVLSAAGAKLSEPILIEKQYYGVDGPYIDFECWATISTRDGRFVRTMGNRATYDDFFAKRTRWVCPQCKALTVFGKGCPEHGRVQAEKEGYYLPLSEVDVPSVKQAAITNLWNHALEDIGLKPSLRDLEEAGMDTSKLARVQFGEDGQQAAAPAAPQAGAANSGNKAKAAPQPPKTPAPARPEARGATQTAPPKGNPQPQAKTPQKGPGPPKAEIPSDWPIGHGYVTEVASLVTSPKNGKPGGRPYRVVMQSGHRLYCFDDRKLDATSVFALLDHSVEKLCHFVVKEGQFPTIQPLPIQVGELEWDETGMSVLRREPPMREPGDDEPELFR